MDWDGVRNIVSKSAPLLGTALGGPAGGAIGGAIAAVLGVENSPDAIEAELRKDPAALLKLKGLEADLERARIETRGQVVQAEAQGESWLQRNWRPLTMIWFSVLIGGYWFGYTPPNLSEAAVLSLFGLMKLGLGGYVIGRSAEKITQHATGSGLLDKFIKPKG
ncbi:MAG: hypothetical protein HLX50_07570 [Alteromonadaceae bacterium]|nr:hypothetical protein [Alteromonadaceae bacterium]